MGKVVDLGQGKAAFRKIRGFRTGGVKGKKYLGCKSRKTLGDQVIIRYPQRTSLLRNRPWHWDRLGLLITIGGTSWDGIKQRGISNKKEKTGTKATPKR